MGIIDEQIERHRLWCEGLGIQSTEDINRLIDGGKINELISVCEERHEHELADIASAIRQRGSRAVFIAGPSSSGKTTTALKLQSHLKMLNINAVSVSLDDYYMENELMPKNAAGEPDFEALESIDYRRFNENLADLTAGREVIMPEFSFTRKKVIPEAKKMKLRENEIVIVEGIHALNPKLAENIGENEKFRLYCTALSTLKDKSGERIPSHMVRLTRRLVRDYYFRSSDYRITFALWPNQEISAERNIYPYADSADVVFNSSLLYELNVYREHLLKVLDGAGGDYEFIEDVQYLRNLAKSLKTISGADVPELSLIHEFIGGGTLKY